MIAVVTRLGVITLKAYQFCGPGITGQKKSLVISHEAVVKNRQRLTLPGFILVPSALAGLTALFGMGRGDPRRYSHLKILR